MKTCSFLLALLLLLSVRFTARAQSVGIGTATPDAKAALDIVSSGKGLLIPRLSAAQRGAIAAPPQGLMVYQTDAPEGFYYFGGSPGAWVFLNPAGGGADNLGNHTATTSLNLGANALVGTGASLGTAVGLGVRADGGLNLGQNTLGQNFFIGYQAGQSTTPASFNRGSGNQFVGYQSGFNNTTGGANTFSGYQSGYANTTGVANQFSGYRSGLANTTGSQNQFSGYLSGQANTTGSSNQFSGYASGYSNTTGSNNYFSGYQSGYSNTTGLSNHFSGYQSGYSNTTGLENQFVGFQSGYNNTTGSRNVFIGLGAGNNNRTGDTNYAIGYGAGPTTGNLTNAGAIGYQAQVSQSNSLVLGGTGANAVNVGIGTSSPGQRLEVNGNISTTGTVNMGWTQVSGTFTAFATASAINPNNFILACPSGMRVLGGGGGFRDQDAAADNINVNYSGPDPNDPERKWRVIVTNRSNFGLPIRVYCNCARIGP